MANKKSELLEPEPSGNESNWSRIVNSSGLDGVPVKTIVVTVLTVALVYLTGKFLYRLRDLMLIMLVGGFVALILNPCVVMLQHWKIKRRGAAVAVVSLMTFVVFLALAFAFGYPLVHSLTHLANTLPQYVKKAEHGKGWIGHLFSKYHLENWVKTHSSKLISLAQGLSKPALSLGKGAISALLGLVTVFAFIVLLLLEGPKIRHSLLFGLSPERSDRVLRVSSKVGRSTSGYMLGNLLTSLSAGVVVLITLTSLSVPFAFLWALWVALVDFLPTIGGALAGIPTVLFAFGHSTTAGIVTAIVFLIYTQFENHVLTPIVMSRTVKLNPLAVFLAVLVGAEVGAWVGGLFGGFVGVLLAVPGAAVIQILIRETRTPSSN